MKMLHNVWRFSNNSSRNGFYEHKTITTMKLQCHDCIHTQYLEFLNDSSILIHITDDYHGPYNYHHKMHENNATQNQKNTYQFRLQNTAVCAHRWLGVVWPPAPATLSQGSCHPMTVSAPYSNHWCKWLLWCRPVAVRVRERERERERKRERGRERGREREREECMWERKWERECISVQKWYIWLTCVPSATSGTSGR